MAVFHFTEKGGNAVGMGQEMSFKIAEKNIFKISNCCSMGRI